MPKTTPVFHVRPSPAEHKHPVPGDTACEGHTISRLAKMGPDLTREVLNFLDYASLSKFDRTSRGCQLQLSASGATWNLLNQFRIFTNCQRLAVQARGNVIRAEAASAKAARRNEAFDLEHAQNVHQVQILSDAVFGGACMKTLLTSFVNVAVGDGWAFSSSFDDWDPTLKLALTALLLSVGLRLYLRPVNDAGNCMRAAQQLSMEGRQQFHEVSNVARRALLLLHELERGAKRQLTSGVIQSPQWESPLP